MKNTYQAHSVEEIHPDLIKAQKLVYDPNGLHCKRLVKELESGEYGAFEFELHGQQVKFRVAKITPTKMGLFVTLWKRVGNGPILPYDMSDPIDLFIVSVRNGEHFGQFVFPKAVLCEKGIVARGGRGGKRAMRVYPPWDALQSQQAKRTQTWQSLYFFEIQSETAVDSTHLGKLFRIH